MSFLKIREKEDRIVSIWGWYRWEGRVYQEKCRSVIIVEILCTHACKWKTRLVETIPGMGKRRIKENHGGHEFKYDIL
jgi:hypothetical protein